MSFRFQAMGPKKNRKASSLAAQVEKLSIAPPIPELDERPRPRRLVDAISVYVEGNALLALAHRDKNELRACLNYVMGGLYLHFAEKSLDENVCPNFLRELQKMFGEGFRVPEYLFLVNLIRFNC
ncbi:hypothetical protein Y032_0015g2762 [Ancylostoma ceylanicum]|uniref:Uncharacterized protein n=1 Tax=Ancylostoma ceylanicum TaxID=53326 RepID=A0A016V8Q4_9BILA|nr:hypothetical protein Y032_0015g2762 [Ancylostoma ceylanicum]